MDKKQSNLWQNQDNIQKQFIPDLNETLEKYFETLKIASNLNEDELKQAKIIIDEFLSSGQGPELQRRLLEESQKKFNPQAEHWTNRVFLSRRDGLFATSYGGSTNYLFDQAPIKYEKIGDTEYTYQQIYLAALTIEAIYDYYQMIIDGKIQQEYLAQTFPLCMSQYKNLFSTRIPQLKTDINYYPFPNIPKHFIITIEDQLYAIKVVEDETNKLIPIDQIFKQIEQVVLSNKNDNNKQFPLGVYTSFNRDYWANIYQRLGNDQDNNQNFKLIKESLSIICLEQDEVDNDFDKQLLFNRVYKLGRNRWYDKQLIAVLHSRAIMNRMIYDHSQVDGNVALIAGTQIYSAIKQKIDNVRSINFELLKNVQNQKQNQPFKLQWKNIEKIYNEEEYNKQIQLNMNYVSEACQIRHLSTDFDLEFYKKYNINMYPFLLACLAISHFIVHKEFIQMIQTAHTRQFKHGRVEWVRQVTKQYKQLVNKFDYNSLKISQNRSEFKQLYSKFEEKFNRDMKGALFGHGIDRHLNALKYQLLENEKCRLFEDISFQKFMNIQLFFTTLPPVKQQITLKEPGTFVSYPYLKEQYKFDIIPYQKYVIIMLGWYKSNTFSNKPKQLIEEFFKVKTVLEGIYKEEISQSNVNPKL